MTTSLDESIEDANRLLALLNARSRETNEEAHLSPDPARHICTPHTCPFLTHNGDQTLVCSVSGICHGQRACNDIITAGRSKRLDDNGCVVGRALGRERTRRRRNVAGDSKRAMLIAQNIEDEVGYGESSQEAKRPCLAVRTDSFELSSSPHSDSQNQSDDTNNPSSWGEQQSTPRKSPKDAGRETDQRPRTVEQVQQLHDLATDIIDSLTGSSRRLELTRLQPSSKQDEPPPNAPALFVDHGRRYLLRQTLSGMPPNLNDLHDLCINVREMRAKYDRRLTAHNNARDRSLKYMRIRDAAAKVAVALWIVLLGSKYMTSTKRSGDTFRPFAASVFFGMRSGVRLENGLEIVPICPAISNALPEVRSQHKERHSHTNHLSAHRGAYTLHHSLASIPADCIDRAFAPVKNAVANLQRVCQDWQV